MRDEIEIQRLQVRSLEYARQLGVAKELQDALASTLQSPEARRLVSLPASKLYGKVLNDAYKPKMHKLYSEYFGGVTATFALNTRKTPCPLQTLATKEPELFAELEQDLEQLQQATILTPQNEEALQTYYNFQLSEAMRARLQRHGVAPLAWSTLPDNSRGLFATGPIEAASNAETSTTQLVQDITIRAQVAEIEKQKHVHLDRTERVANSLGRLAMTVQRINSIGGGFKVALFAGRRASDRTFLLLQNLFCCQHMKGCLGTSSVFAAGLIDEALQQEGFSQADRRSQIGALVGTHAHEVASIAAQLLAQYDDKAGGSPDAPVPISAIVAHLLFLTSNGGLGAAVALADTFGTEAFLAIALAADVPREFLEDVRQRYPDEPQPKPGGKVFDLFATWRLDSGDYAAMAKAVKEAWRERCRQCSNAAERPSEPGLMNSNLSSVEELEAMARLPEGIQPDICAFGGLADGFAPFPLPDGSTAELAMASIVMKAVQAHHPGVSPTSFACAGKLGDDTNRAKAQVDPRLPKGQQEAAKERMVKMSQAQYINPGHVTGAVARAYHAVTREKIFG